MITFVPTPRSFRWRKAVTWPCAIGILGYVSSIAALVWLNGQTERSFTPCLFKNVTGLPCFLCGGTRSSLSLAKGDVVSAFFFNPLVCAVLILAAALLLLKVATGRRIAIAPHARSWLWLATIVAVALNWAYLVTHL